MIKTRIIKTSKLLFCAAVVVTASGYQALAQNEFRSSMVSAPMVAASTVTAAIYLYASESDARERLNTEIRRGKSARMYYDQSRSRWVVEVKG